MEREVVGGDLFRGNFTRGGLCQNPFTKFFLFLLLFLNFTCEDEPGNCPWDIFSDVRIYRGRGISVKKFLLGLFLAGFEKP